MSEKNNFATQQFNLVKDRNEFAGWTVSDLTKEGGQGSVCGIKNGRQKRVFKCLKENPESESVARFIREVGILSNIDHSNIVKLRAVSLNPPYWYITDRGATFSDFWQRFRKRSNQIEIETKALDFVRQLANALQCIHAVGMVHRDVKMPNIIVLDGRPVLIDFGIAFEPSETTRLTDVKKAPGNEKFSHDAQRWSSETPPPWWDVYSLVQVFQFLMSERDPKSHWRRPVDWRYVRYPDDSSGPFVDALRTISAMSSVEARCPVNGDALLNLIDELFQPAESIQSKHGLIPEAIAITAHSDMVAKKLQETQDSVLEEVDFEIARTRLNSLLAILKSFEGNGVTFEAFDSIDSLRGTVGGDLEIARLVCRTGERSININVMVSSFATSRFTRGGNAPPEWQKSINLYVFRFERVAGSKAKGFPEQKLHFTIDRETTSFQVRDLTWAEIKLETSKVQDLTNIFVEFIRDEDAWNTLA